MLDLSAARLEAAVFHLVGNKNQEDGYFLSKESLWLQQNDVSSFLRSYATKPFTYGDTQNFSHSSSLEMNETYVFCKRIFENNEVFLETSCELAKHLYEQCTHPQIKSGEFLVCLLSGCHFENKELNAIAMFKIEHKDVFMRLLQVGDGFDTQLIEGLPQAKPDKSCLILETDEEKGYAVLVTESKKGADEQYWRDHFLQVKPASDNFNFTNTILKVTKDFVTREMPEEFTVSKTDSFDLLTRSMDYFKTNDQFDKKDFAETVFKDDRVIDSFMKYEEDFCKYNELPSAEIFEINNQAVKKQSRVYKSILKLDRNFHIYIHGNRDLLEKGTDDDGRKFYKIYFENEE